MKMHGDASENKYQLLVKEFEVFSKSYSLSINMIYRTKQQITELTAANEHLQSSLQHRESSLQSIRDENLRLISALKQMVHSNQSFSDESTSATILSSSSPAALPSSFDPSVSSLRSELIACRRQRDELEVCLQAILQDLEERTPLVTALKRDYDILRQNYERVMRVWRDRLTYS